MIRIIGCINGFEYKLIISTFPGAMQKTTQKMHTQLREEKTLFNFLCYVNADGIHTLKAERGRYYEEMRLGLRSCSGYLQLGQEVIFGA